MFNNYRPISGINNFSNIFEMRLRDRLLDFYSKNGVLSRNQFGFSNDLSTTDAIRELTNYVTNNLDSGKRCSSVFLDLVKAFRHGAA